MRHFARPLLGIALAAIVLLASVFLPALNFSRSMRSSEVIHYLEGGSTPLAWFMPPPANVGPPYGSATTSSIGYCETLHGTAGLRSLSEHSSSSRDYYQSCTSVGFPFTVLRHIEQDSDPTERRIGLYRLLGCTIALHTNFVYLYGAGPRGIVISSALRFPTTLFWPGFLANTILSCGLVWFLIAGSRRLVRQRRMAKGLCPTCAFEIKQLPRCPECGTLAAPSPKPVS